MIKKYLLQNKRQSSVVIIFAFMQSLFAAGLAVIFSIIVDYAELLRSGEISHSVFVYGIIFLFCYIVIFAVFDFLRRYFRADLIVRLNEQIKADYFIQMMEIDTEQYSKTDSGHFMSRFTNDLPTLIREYVIEVFNVILYIFQVFWSIIVAFYVNWIIAIVFLVLSLIIVFFTTKFEKKFAALRANQSKANSSYTVCLKSSLQGFDEIKESNAESVFGQKYIESLKEPNILLKKWWRLEAFYSPGTAFLTYLLTFSAIVISSVLYSVGYFSIGLLAASIYLSTIVFNPISFLFEQLTHLKSLKKLSEDIYKDFSSAGKRSLEVTVFKEKISFAGVSFAYEENREIIDKATFDILKGKKYLVVGESGIGKSTLLKILAGKLRYSGEIKIDDIELNEAMTSSLNSIMSYVPQNPYLFYDTLRNNIDLAKQYSDDEIMSVIERVALSKFVSEKGLDVTISEEVFEVSGGEKQRIALARALTKNPKILLLDEVTAALDKSTGEEIDKLIVSLDNMTVMYICHKASEWLIESFDHVIDFEGKNIRMWESGIYAKRIAREA